MDETGVVTPEGVLLDYRPAGLATRTMGRLIDLSLMAIVVYTAATVGLVLLVGSSAALVVIYLILVGFVVVFGYPVGFEVYGGGRTPGHRATGTKVIRTDGGPIGLRHASIRAMLFLVDGFATTGFAGAVSVLVTRRGQRLGDLAAGTMVIRLDRPVMQPGPPPRLTPDLRARALEFDRRRLRADDVATARMLVERGAQLREGAQVDLAERVAVRLDTQLGNVRRGGDAAIDFIHAVLDGEESGPTTGPEPVSSPRLHKSEILLDFVAPEQTASDLTREPFSEVGVPLDVEHAETDEPQASDESASPDADDLGFAPPT